jgi:Caspase domain
MGKAYALGLLFAGIVLGVFLLPVGAAAGISDLPAVGSTAHIFEKITDATGVTLAIPVDLVGREPKNRTSWGNNWESAGISIDTLNFTNSRKIDELYNSWRKRVGRVISSSDFRPDHSFMLAGSEDAGTTQFYIEVRAQNDELRGLSITYNTRDQAELSGVVRDVIASFDPFPSGASRAEKATPSILPSPSHQEPPIAVYDHPVPPEMIPLPPRGFERIIDTLTGVTLVIPLDIVGRQPQNQAWGHSWASAKLSVDTLNFSDNRKIDELYNALKRKPGRVISSRDSYLTPGRSFVLEGTDDDGTTQFYINVRAQNGELRGLSIAYNTSDRDQLSGVVREIRASFDPFPSGMVFAEVPKAAPSIPPVAPPQEPRIAMHETAGAPEATPNPPAAPPQEPRIAMHETAGAPEATPNPPAAPPQEPRIAMHETAGAPEATPNPPAAPPQEPRIAMHETAGAPEATPPSPPVPSPRERRIVMREAGPPEARTTPDLPTPLQGVPIASPDPRDSLADKLQSCPAFYDKRLRIALVMGNSEYDWAGYLSTPRLDAEAVATKLTELQFDVVEGKMTNLNRREMIARIKEFGERLDRAAKENTAQPVAIFFYSGHGVQVGGENYLLPVDIQEQDGDEINEYAIPLTKILGMLATKSTCANIVLLDACRNNKLSFKGGPGLAKIPEVRETIVEYSSLSTQVASDDGQQGVSPFTSAFLENLKAGLRIQDVLERITPEVERKTNYKQSPTHFGVIGKNVVLQPQNQTGLQ